MEIIHAKEELTDAIRRWRAIGKTIALVPTMGALHSGHVALMRRARQEADIVMVYIFVNRLQFAPHEDFDCYPRPWEKDVGICRVEKVDALYAPSEAHMYPDGFGTAVTVSGVSEELDGISRPHFFGGVATVLTKMFIRILPDVALFGEKDYQQLQVVKKLVRDLDLPIRIIGVPTEREEQGLAKSSRNLYLSPSEAAIAPKLYAVMQDAAKKIRQGADIAATLTAGREALLAAGFTKIDYLELRDAETLAPLTAIPKAPARLLAAAWLGTTRLIDNILV